jgi:hypothetical protein
MSEIRNGILGAIAISLTFGAVQLASGHDLTGGWRVVPQAASIVLETAVNRAAKADRAAVVAPQVATRTIALRLDRLADTSILVRVPVARNSNENSREEARGRPATPLMLKSGERRTTVACEPVVSVLTEVAKLLQPGRCVT